MDIYFTDRKFNVIGIASAGGDGPIQIMADIDYQLAPNSVGRSYSGTLVTDPANAAKLAEMAALGNFVLYQDPRGKYVFATVMEWSDAGYDPQNGQLSFVAENGGIDLINETVGAYKAAKAMSIADYIKLFTADSGFEIGINEIANLTRTLEWDSDDETALARIESVATQFDNAELDFRFEVSGTAVVKRYIDIYKHIGADKGQRLEVNTQVNSIKTTGNIYDLFTSIEATGGTPEGKDVPITLKGYKWTDPDGRYVLGDDGILRDTVAVQLWSRALSNDNPTPNNHHIQRVKTYDATTQATLLQSALSDLKQSNHASINYVVDVADLPDQVQIGDTVHLVDEAQGLNLSARLLELKDSYTNDTHEATLGDYLIEANQIDPQYRALAEELAKQNKGKDGVGLKSSIVAYQAGTSGTTAPTGVWSEAVPTVSPSQFLWSRTVLTMTDRSMSTTYSVGKMGANGTDGIGLKSSTVTYQIGTNGTTAPSGTWSSTIPPASQGTYLWSRTLTFYTDGKQDTSYSVAYQGIDGPQGPQGVPGSQDVPMTYVQTAQPTGQIVKDSIWWVGATMSSVTALKRWNGSAWIPETISQNVLNVVSLNAVKITGSTFASANSRVIADGEEELYTVGTTLANTQTLDKMGYTSVAQGSIMGDTTPNSFKATTTIGNAGSIRSRADFASGDWSIITIDPTQSAMTMNNSQGISGTLNADYLSMVNNCGEILWTGAMFMQHGQIVTPSISLTKCLFGWNLVWQPYDNGVVSNGGGIIVTPVYKTIAMSIGKTHAWNYGMYSYNHGNAFLTKYFYVGSLGDTISGNDQNAVGNSRYYVLTKVVAF